MWLGIMFLQYTPANNSKFERDLTFRSARRGKKIAGKKPAKKF